MSGTGRITVVPYDPVWPAEFEALATPLRAALGPLALSVEHVGSTSVPGLAAKPIIDIDVVISSRLKLQKVVAKLAELSYEHQGDLGIAGREAFRWPTGTRRHHLYVCSVETPNLHAHLLLRDYLRLHPDRALEYGQLKERLARQHPTDIDAYTTGKDALIGRLMQEAAALSRLYFH